MYWDFILTHHDHAMKIFYKSCWSLNKSFQSRYKYERKCNKMIYMCHFALKQLRVYNKYWRFIYIIRLLYLRYSSLMFIKYYLFIAVHCPIINIALRMKWFPLSYGIKSSKISKSNVTNKTWNYIIIISIYNHHFCKQNWYFVYVLIMWYVTRKVVDNKFVNI